MENQNNNFYLILFLGILFTYLLNEYPKIIYKL